MLRRHYATIRERYPGPFADVERVWGIQREWWLQFVLDKEQAAESAGGTAGSPAKEDFLAAHPAAPLTLIARAKPQEASTEPPSRSGSPSRAGSAAHRPPAPRGQAPIAAGQAEQAVSDSEPSDTDEGRFAFGSAAFILRSRCAGLGFAAQRPFPACRHAGSSSYHRRAGRSPPPPDEGRRIRCRRRRQGYRSRFGLDGVSCTARRPLSAGAAFPCARGSGKSRRPPPPADRGGLCLLRTRSSALGRVRRFLPRPSRSLRVAPR